MLDWPLASPPPPALIATIRGGIWLAADGTTETLTGAEAGRRARAELPLVCHAPNTAQHLDCRPFPALDLLELYAFVRPARFCLPTPRGLARTLDLDVPATAEDEALALLQGAALLLRELAGQRGLKDIAELAWSAAQAGWEWGPAALAALDAGHLAAQPGAGLAAWHRLPKWEESAPQPPAGDTAVSPAEARTRLADLVGGEAEERPEQADYASALTPAFAPRPAERQPNVVLAEAGTGVGKTLGYLAPATVWAERNRGAVWISTYTKNLQRQVDTELTRVFPDPLVHRRKVVIRKGRENYLCLLNYEDLTRRAQLEPDDAIAAALVARWVVASRDGDIVGGDFPAWLVDLLGRARTLGLADRRGECIYSACEHYQRCFIERSVRRARQADIVVANHALVMIQAALGGLDDASLPSRYVFDEGHHIFDAADSAFGAHLSGQEGADLRRWLLGAEGSRASRARGLERRIGDLAAADEAATKALQEVIRAARGLPAAGWLGRISESAMQGPVERFLALVHAEVRARAAAPDSPYGLECEIGTPPEALLAAALEAADRLETLRQPMQTLDTALAAFLDTQTAELETAERNRIEAVMRGLTRRSGQLGAWIDMLRGLADPTPEEFVDWFAIERIAGREIDCGMYRHWVDPTLPFARAVIEPSHGAVITSASLRDGTPDGERNWLAAEARTGGPHLAAPPIRATVASPFDYPTQTRVLIVKDVRKDRLDQVAAAYRELFLAARGGALGLFTAISRLRAVQERLAAPLADAGLSLYAQHVDRMDTATLVDIFRAEENSCLLGTDAVRDGVDVPGRALRLIVFDRVPWPRPDILHKARRKAWAADYGEARGYDDMLARFRLKQAFGRLVRRAGDHGVFVLLDPMTPSRLAGAFPEGVTPEPMGIAEAAAETRAFLAP
jgi:ATP-dependent DNA helicase DinG